ncbi:uncharacterized protein C19orf44 homolog isoform X2 [Denticeps clupeoides]|uniref:DUF4614 domain-containing protein n=1 Tax=Denticeps clupeoides TaxID=299321 RepID=A0AAY4D9M1_9TELE|nr:uncharacterized protein C19orf44 homolog isoform X2 [Denticeps clupeoides]
MWRRGGVKSAALEKAAAQLAGKRMSSAPQAGLGGVELQNKVKARPKSGHRPLQDLSGFFSEDGSEPHEDRTDPTVKAEMEEASGGFAVGGGSRFLKKTPKVSGLLSTGMSEKPTEVDEPTWSSQQNPRSAALSRLALIEHRVKSRKESSQAVYTDLPSTNETPLPPEACREPSMEGSRFRKKSSGFDVERWKNSESTLLNPKTVSPFKADVSLDSDEEDMKQLLGESLNSHQGSPDLRMKSEQEDSRVTELPGRGVSQPTTQGLQSPAHSEDDSPSPFPLGYQTSSRARLFHHSTSTASVHSEIKSLEELFQDADDTMSERSSASEEFNLNIMSLDDLVPAEITGQSVTSKEIEVGLNMTSVKDPMLCPTDEISHEDNPEPGGGVEEYESDFDSEIRSELGPSVSEISEQDSERGKVSYDIHGQREDHRSAFENTDCDQSLSDTPAVGHNKSYESRHSWSRSSRTGSISSRSETSTPVSESRRHALTEAAVQTEAVPPQFTWSSALISYSPAEVALNDLLRQQLALSRHFIQSSHLLHSSLLGSLQPEYRYTTLEETKEIIRRHRSPKLTTEEATADVLEEMRAYHYI